MNKIASERRRQSMTQKRLAFEAGIDARTLRKIEKGETVSAESYRSVCQVLGISSVQEAEAEATEAVTEQVAAPEIVSVADEQPTPLALPSDDGETESQEVKPVEINPDSPRPITLAQLALFMALGMMSIFGVTYGSISFGRFWDDKVTRDVTFVVESEKLCETGWGDALIPRVKAALNDVDVREAKSGMGTHTCEIEFKGKTELTGADVNKQLVDAGFKSKIQWSRY